MTTSQEKVQELNAVVQFWKFRVDELRRHLDKVLARQAAQPQSYMLPLIEMKTRELGDSQRGLRKAQASLGRLLEVAREEAMSIVGSETAASDTNAFPMPEPEPVPSPIPPRERRPVPNEVTRFPLSEFKPRMATRHAL